MGTVWLLHSKMTEWVEQWICIKFCIKVEHSSVETIQMIQKAFRDDAMSAVQITVCRKWFKDGWEFVESDPYSRRPAMSRTPENVGHVGCNQKRLLTLPRIKITFEGEEISDHWWDSGKCNRAADKDINKGFSECFEQWKRCWENCVRSQGAYIEGDWGIIVLCTMFLISCIFNKYFYFS